MLSGCYVGVYVLSCYVGGKKIGLRRGAIAKRYFGATIWIGARGEWICMCEVWMKGGGMWMHLSLFSCRE